MPYGVVGVAYGMSLRKGRGKERGLMPEHQSSPWASWLMGRLDWVSHLPVQSVDQQQNCGHEGTVI